MNDALGRRWRAGYRRPEQRNGPGSAQPRRSILRRHGEPRMRGFGIFHRGGIDSNLRPDYRRNPPVWHTVSDPMWRSALEVLTGATMGSLGAFLSVAGRTEAIHFEPVAGPRIHKIEGAIREIVGISGALLVALAVKADLLLPGVSQRLSHPFLGLLVACFAAGAAERLVPGLIGNMAKSSLFLLGTDHPS